MRKTIQVDLGTPSNFYDGKKRLSVNNAYALYTQGATFKFGSSDMSADELAYRQKQMQELYDEYEREDIKKIQAVLRGRSSRIKHPISPHPKNRVPKPSGRLFEKLPPDMVGEISGLLGSKSMGALAVTRKATAADTKEPMKRTKEVKKEANAKLHEAIGLLHHDHRFWENVAPEEALEKVEEILKGGFKGTKPNLNAVVKPWRERSFRYNDRSTLSPSMKLLDQVIAHKFRDAFVHAYHVEDGDYSNVPIVEGRTSKNDGAEEVSEPVEMRRRVDTSRFRIIKALLDNGARFDKQTVRMALSMSDAFTTVELFKRNAQRPPSSQIKDFWGHDEPGTMYTDDERRSELGYEFQEIDDIVELECVQASGNDGDRWGGGYVQWASEMLSMASEIDDDCPDGTIV